MDSIITVLITLIKFENRCVMAVRDSFFTREFGKQCGDVVADFLCSSNLMELAYEIHSLMEVQKIAESKKEMFLESFNEVMNRIDSEYQWKIFNNVVNFGNEEGVEETE